MLTIENLKINETTMPESATTRSFVVTGDPLSSFIINVVQSGTIKYYNWQTRTFELGHNSSASNLKAIINQGASYRNSIKFPSGGGDYTIILITGPNTVVAGSNNGVINKTISKQANDSQITFTGATASASSYGTLPSTTSTGTALDVNTIPFNWDITSALTDVGGFGLRPKAVELLDENIYFEVTDTVDVTSPKTDTVDGAVSSSAAVTLDDSYLTTNISVGDFVYGTGVTNGTTVAAVNVGGDSKDITLSAAMSITDGRLLTFVTPSKYVFVDGITDLVAKMEIVSVSSGSLTGTPYIVEIDTSGENKLSLSTAQAFADGVTLTFRAKGSSLIKNAIGLNITLVQHPIITPQTLTKTVRVDSDGDFTPSTTVTLNNTHGVGGGNFIRYRGVGVNNTASNLITSVTPDPDGTDEDGLMVVELAQTLRAGTLLTFTDIHSSINISGSIIINGYPAVNRIIYLDLDAAITVGVAS